MTHEEANAILNRFVGWKPGQKCDYCEEYADPTCSVGDKDWHKDHDIPPFDYFADTPEAREQVRLLKDEFVRRTHQDLTVDTYIGCDSEIHFAVNIGKEVYEIESHAIASTIAAALKENRE